ncbi:MAG: hypothetical protein JRI23_21540 [Deltaproteobacteria bacterium]|jgi:hypothetical protein|nr:hypothetical protein [Deltaproteobacteria bacterium]MBW2534526.1 hypothetical protein [Deltaproteobacteria bacterium]
MTANHRAKLPTLLLLVGLVSTAPSLGGCSAEPTGLLLAPPARTTVKVDFFHKPLPDIPLPNDLATRYDASSATGRRINASMVAPSAFMSKTRMRLDRMDGWGVLQPIAIPFTGPIDVGTIVSRHSDLDYDLSDDVIYLVNIDRRSPDFGRLHHLDVGNGNFPVVLETRDAYYKHDPRGESLSLGYEETDEDRNRNGVLDPGEDANGNGSLDPGEDLDGDGVLDPPEDTDGDNILDEPNYLPGHHPAWDDLAGRADALMTFYEKSTNTLIAQPMMPLRERTVYAVVVTRRLLDAGGEPVGSPYPYINHTAQTQALQPLLEVLPSGLAAEDIAFAFSFTTQTIEASWIALREGLYGRGPQAHLGTDFPARLSSIPKMRDQDFFPTMRNPHLLYGEVWQPAFDRIATDLLELPEGEWKQALVDGVRYIDFVASGTLESPQLFERYDDQGNFLSLADQAWPEDLDRVPAPTRSETLHVTFVIPRKEISARGDGKPAPVVVAGHGYQTNRFESVQLANYLTQFGVATITIDGPSHGIGLGDLELAVAKGLASEFGMSVAIDSILADRAFDQNGDELKDPGADFWSSYLFHTRDMVRQFSLDYLQLVRLIRSFDGKRRWDFDLDGDGENELAGDFDADGVVDIGGDAPIYSFGGSLGGFMATLLASLEPAVELTIPISAGGGVSYIGMRSHIDGVPGAFVLRAMGPLYVGTIDADTGVLLLETIVNDLHHEATVPLARVTGIAPWDTMVAENLVSGERRCGFVSEEGTVRVGVESDEGDRTRVLFYKGPQIMPGDHECVLRSGVEPVYVVDTFEMDAPFQDKYFSEGEPLVALQDGLGHKRSHPDFRRVFGLGQMILDPADPTVMAKHLQLEPLVYPSGEQTGAHALIVTTMGDMGVPAAGGATIGRAAGLIDFLEPDPRYGKSQNQVLIDTYTLEGVHNLKRYTDSEGNGVHLDVENFAEGDDMYGAEVPRLDSPLRIGMDETDRLGGVSAAIFPYNIPEGMHAFDFPGLMTDKARDECRAECTETEVDDPCGCNGLETFDIGFFMTNLLGRYAQTGGKELPIDRCLSRNDCDFIPPPPPVRTLENLP